MEDDVTLGVSPALVENDGDTVSYEISAPDGYVFDEIQDNDDENKTIYFKRK